MSSRRRLAAFAVVAQAVMGLGSVCNQENRPPVVESITGPNELLASDTAHLTCVASDPDGDSLSYVWDCTKGHLTPRGAQASWAAPGTTTTGTVLVSVADEAGLDDFGNKTISVLGMTIPWFELHMSWHELGASSRWTEMTEGTKIRVMFDVEQDSLERTINFAVLDSANHNRWMAESSYSSLLRLPHTKGDTLSYAVPSAGTYYLCWDNWGITNQGHEFWATILLSIPDSADRRRFP